MNEVRNIAKKIKEQINKNELKMKPKAYFVIGNIVAIIGVIIFAVASTISVNMIIHFFRVGRFGSRLAMLPIQYKIKALMIVFPWEFLLIAIGFIILGVCLIRKFEDGYKNSITVLITLFAIIVLMTGLALDKSGFNEKAKKYHIMRKVYDQRREIPNYGNPEMRGNPESGVPGVKGTGVHRPGMVPGNGRNYLK